MAEKISILEEKKKVNYRGHICMSYNFNTYLCKYTGTQ